MAEGGFRGYIVSRPVRGSHFPQRVQNLVVRDYAQRRGLHYLLSATEYAMPGCTMMLESLLDGIAELDGIILFSMFTLPVQTDRRARVYERVLGAGKSLHAALEQLSLTPASSPAAWEDMLAVENVLAATPFGGRYDKNDAPLGTDRSLLAAFGL